MHVHNDAGRGLGVINLDCLAQLLAHHMLGTEIERDRHRLVVAHGELRIIVDEFLDAGEAFVVDVDQPDHMASRCAHWIDAAIFLDEGEARQTKLVDFLLLLRRQFAFDADEASAGPKLGAERLGVNVGEHARHLLGQFVNVDNFGRIGVKRRALDIGGEQTAVAIENVRAVHRRGNVVQTGSALTHTGEAERHQPSADQKKGKRKGKASQTEAVAASCEIGSLGTGCGGVWLGGLCHDFAELLD